MSTDKTGETAERCNAECRDGTRCQNWPISGSSRCRMHGGQSTGPPVGSANNFKHGATANPANLPAHLDDEDVAWIQALVEGYLEEAPFGPDSPKVERLTRTCVMIYQEWAGQEAILQQGMGVGKMTRSEGPEGNERGIDVTVTADGEMIAQTEEHYLCKRIDRLNDKIRMNLKDLGLLDDPDSQRADAEQGKAEAIRELMQEADQHE